MEWNTSLSTRVPLLDEHHRALFEYLGHLERAHARQEAEAFGDAIDHLRRYALHHFATEEQLMKLHRYPALPEHMAAHKEFSDRLSVFRTSSAHRDIAPELIEFVRGWLTDHVSRRDMDYVPYLVAVEDQ